MQPEVFTVCAVCGKALKGRSDKKYCGKSCSNSFHACRKKEEDGAVASISRALKSNRGILKRLLGGSPCATVSESDLSGSGFDFESCTSVRPQPDGSLVKECYDYSYSREGSSGKVVVRPVSKK